VQTEKPAVSMKPALNETGAATCAWPCRETRSQALPGAGLSGRLIHSGDVWLLGVNCNRHCHKSA
jgi:hypothetical protein